MRDGSEGSGWESIGAWFSEQGVWFLVTLAVAIIVFVAFRRLTPRVVSRIVVRTRADRTKREQEELSRTVARLVRWIGTLLILVAAVLASLPRFGIDLAPVGAAVVDWLASHGVRIVVIVVLAAVAHQIVKRIINALVETHVLAGKRRPAEALRKRADTLSQFFTQFVLIVIWVIAGFMMLAELGLNIAPLLAGAGVLGIGIGFGAQSVVKDVLAGLFVIMENQYRVGDVVKVADVIGVVEEVNMRRTILRDLDGIVHVVPNGEIKVASNYTKVFSRVNLNISVAYGEDLDRAMRVIDRVGEEMAQEEYWSQALVTAPKSLRVDNLGDSGIDIKILGDTKPIRQWEVMGELRKRIKKAFDEEGIEIPWPHTKVYFGEAPKALAGVPEAPRAGPEQEVTAEEPPAKPPRRRKRPKVIPAPDEGD